MPNRKEDIARARDDGRSETGLDRATLERLCQLLRALKECTRARERLMSAEPPSRSLH